MDQQKKLEYSLNLIFDGSSEIYLDNKTRDLLSEIKLIEGLEATLERKPGISGKPLDSISIGIILLSLAPNILPPLFDLLREWIKRDKSRRIKISRQKGKEKIEIEISKDTSPEELKEYLKALS